MDKPFYLKQFALHQGNKAHILDVGAGTGIVSLMMTQRFSDAEVEAWEVEEGALKDAATNFATSPFADRLRIHSQDYLHAKQEDWHPFDLIISNPPYYTEGILPDDARLRLARHVAEGLSPENLLRTAAQLLAPRGALAFISPAASLPSLRRIAVESGWRLSELVTIYSKPGEVKRTLTLWCRLTDTAEYTPTYSLDLTLQDATGAPSAEYKAWLRDFLL